MNHSLRIAFVAGTLSIAAGPVSGKAGREIGPGQMLCLHLYNEAQASTGTLRSATVETARIFRMSGIQMNWQQPSAESPEDAGLDMSSAIPRNPDERHYLVVRIVRGMPLTVFPGALGFSLPFARRGAHVSIFYDRVEMLARSVNTAPYVILGHAIAHEIGHVLLHSSEHTSGGLMQARWSPASWRLASAGLLTFRPEETERMGEALGRFFRSN